MLYEGDFVLWAFNGILRYLANTPGGLARYPNERRARASVDQRSDWQATDFNARGHHAFPALLRGTPATPDAERIAQDVRAWSRGVTMLNSRLADTNACVAGVAFTLADIAGGLSVHRWRETPIAQIEAPAVEACLTRWAKRPAWRRYASAATP